VLKKAPVLKISLILLSLGLELSKDCKLEILKLLR